MSANFPDFRFSQQKYNAVHPLNFDMKENDMDFNKITKNIFDGVSYGLWKLSLLLTLYLVLFSRVANGFNSKTYNNTYQYLTDNQNDIIWTYNPSGFVRTELPTSLYHAENDINCDRLRINYWHNENGTGLIDPEESIHNHPKEFHTNIVHGSYVHEIYSEINGDETEADEYFQFHLDKSKNIEFKNEKAKLKKINEIETHPGEINKIDDKMIHRVKHYKQDTLTLNCVTNKGKGYTGLFFRKNKQDNVIGVVTKASQIESKKITNKALNIFSKVIDSQKETQAETNTPNCKEIKL